MDTRKYVKVPMMSVFHKQYKCIFGTVTLDFPM